MCPMSPKLLRPRATAATAPLAPTALSATAGNAQVSLTWTAPASNGGAAITQYNVQYRPAYSLENNFTQVTSADVNVTSLTVTGLTNGVALVFRVAAVNAIGVGEYSPLSSGVTPAGAPLAPISVGATPGNAQVVVSWSLPLLANQGPAITDYTVQYSSNSGSSWTTFSRAASTATSATVTGLVNGTVYTFRVAAVNSVGTGAYSSGYPLVTPRTTPGAPTSLAATAGDTQVVLSWNAPASNGGAAITDYTVQYSTDIGSTWATFSRAASTATTATVTGLTNGTAYVFRVAAVNVAGTGAYATTAGSATPSAPVSVSPLHLANGFLSTLRNDTVTDSEFPNAALANGYLSVLRVSDTISDAEFPNAALGNGFLHVLSVDPVPSGPTVTGGTVTTPGDGYTYRTFTSDGTLGITGASLTCDVLVVGGGGPCQWYAKSGGGGGGVLYQTNQTILVGNYPVVVGNGGNGGDRSRVGITDGQSSSFASRVATGGIRGNVGPGGYAGGSGGQSGFPTSVSNTVGNLGGSGDGDEVTGGGGGAGGIGGTAVWPNNGTGGAGVSVFGVVYGGGGNGGIGGTAPTPNRGRGADGAGDSFGNASLSGGSGIVIVRYLSP
jgi:titin